MNMPTEVSVSVSVSSLVQMLADLVGPTVAATLSGTRRRADIDDWIKGIAQPDAAQLSRLRFAFEQIDRVATAESLGVARIWLVAENIDDKTSPYLAIRSDRFDEARISATRMVNDTNGY